MAIILGCLNGLGTMVGAVFILYAQEVLHTTVFIFAILGTGGAIGGILGGIFAPKLSAALGRVNSDYRFLRGVRFQSECSLLVDWSHC